MPTSVLITAPNLKEWRKAGIKMGDGIDSSTIVMRLNIALEARFNVMEKQMFRTQGASGTHGRWDDLNPLYAEVKRKMFGVKLVMRRTNKLSQSLTRSNADSIARGSNQAMGYFFRFGTFVPYAEFHQKGGTKIKGVPPERKLLDPNEQSLRGIALAIARTITDGLFSRRFFDIYRTKLTKIPFKYTGFEKVDIP